MALRRSTKPTRWLMPVLVVAGLLAGGPSGLAQSTAGTTSHSLKPHFAKAVAFDASRPLRDIARQPSTRIAQGQLRPERGPFVADRGYSGDGALQSRAAAPRIPAPLLTFEGLANADNAIQVSPPNPVGDVGPNHYVEMVNLVFAVYSKTGARLLGPVQIGALWDGFAVPDCADRLAGDPVVLYDQLEDRWLLTQFSVAGPTFYNCIAVSQTGDPTGPYFRYAFSTGLNFPDYPKYGVWSNAYFITTREFAPDDSFAGDGIYALERDKMLAGDPGARAVSFLLAPGTTPWLPGDGLLPPDIDGSRRPPARSTAPFVGTMDDGAQYGAPFDALNVFSLSIAWSSHPTASFGLTAQLSVASFDSIFPCEPPPNTRDCIPQPGTTNKLDILSYRQRPTWRLAYRNFGTYETLVTNQSVEARPGVAGVRWYEIRRVGKQFSLFQQGTFAPDDGVHRWMGSIAINKSGGMGLGYSVSNATTVFPGIRYTGRLAGDAVGEMTLGEGVMIDGSGSQLGPTSRWGDYTSMNVDSTDDCTFWYVNEYYQTSSARGWQTRIGSFRLPGC